jgi:hypothetical protein
MSFSIFPAGIAAAARFNKSGPVFYPFIFCTWLACINEILSYLLSRQGISNVANNNIYILAEVLLINWQAKRWNLYQGFNRLYLAVQALCLVAWFYDIHSIDSLQQLHFYSRLVFGVVIIISSIHISTGLIFSAGKQLTGNPAFLVCTGYILFFILKILVDALWLYDPGNSVAFRAAVYAILAWVNVFVNLLFLTAIICIPPKPRFIIL